LYNPAIKPGLSRKFSKPWTGPYKVTVKISDLNYEIVDQKGRKQVVHINRLKRAHDPKMGKAVCGALVAFQNLHIITQM